MKRKSKVPGKQPKGAESAPARIYTLEVLLLEGPITETFAAKNPTVSRTIQIRGDQTLKDLHRAIFKAFERYEQHMYEFQFDKQPKDRATLDSLDLEVGGQFEYLFDFGDEWWHQIDVTAIEEEVPTGEYPKVTNKVGASPPQYPLEEDSEESDFDEYE